MCGQGRAQGCERGAAAAAAFICGQDVRAEPGRGAEESSVQPAGRALCPGGSVGSLLSVEITVLLDPYAAPK